MKTLLFVLSGILVASQSHAVSKTILGDYSVPTKVRFPGYTEADCKAEKGDLVDDLCYLSTTNNVSIVLNAKKQLVVKIAVVFGAANMRDFAGVVTKTRGNILYATEAEIDDQNVVGAKVKDGCRVRIKPTATNGLAITLNSKCDPNLGRAQGAKKQR